MNDYAKLVEKLSAFYADTQVDRDWVLDFLSHGQAIWIPDNRLGEFEEILCAHVHRGGALDCRGWKIAFRSDGAWATLKESK